MIKEDANNKIELFLTADHKKYAYGNKILYDMCNEIPSHTNEHEIVAKVWLIGRSYAAAIERRKNSKKVFANDFYYDIVAPQMIECGREIDERLSSLKKHSIIDEDNIAEIVEVHGFMIRLFKKMTGLEKRSLASKYLHFHNPDLFYIYDSRASHAIKKYVKKENDLELLISEDRACDSEYLDFCIRMFNLQKYIEKKYKRTLTPRDLDNLLLYFT